MSRGRRVILALLAPLLIGVPAADAGHEVAISEEQMRQLGITLVKVEPTRTLMTDQLPARVVIPPQQERVVSAPQPGLVTSLDAAVEDEVQRGELLAQIESPDLISLQRELLQASAQRRLAAADLRRDEQLLKEGIIAERRFLETQTRFDQARAALDEAVQTLRLAGMDEASVAELEKSRKLTSTLAVRAPGAGTVREQLATVGQRVERAEPLYRIAQLEPLWLEIRVPLDRLAGIGVGAAVELHCPSAEAKVTLIGRNVDPTNQTVLVRAEATGSEGCLRPGQFIQVRLRLGSAKRQYRVPTAALARVGPLTVVFVRDAGGFLATPVTVAGEQEGYSVVDGELAKGAEVAASGIAAIKAAWLGTGGAE